MYIKVYFNDKPLFLCDEFNEEISSYVHHDDAVFIDEFSSAAVNSMIHEMRQQKVHAGIFYHEKLEPLKKAFWKKFILIQAGGGLVQNEKEELLLIFRRGKWDLPKGKLDKGETLEQCATREVKEETGLNAVKLRKFLLVTYHTYDESGKHFLKESHWFRMAAVDNQKLVPQKTEQITKLQWANEKEILALAKNTFPSVQDVIRAGGYKIP
ncbi:MAG TPA: NUDIX domain-containing protein [Puia sp.]|nr:NUDIX domain-containing protein [Puia sp.]